MVNMKKSLSAALIMIAMVIGTSSLHAGDLGQLSNSGKIDLGQLS